MESMNDYKEELESSFREINVGDIVEGTVIARDLRGSKLGDKLKEIYGF